MRLGNGPHLNSRVLNRTLVEGLAREIDLDAYPLVSVHAGCWLLRAAQRWPQLPLIVSGRLEVVYQMGSEGNQVIPVVFGDGELAMMSSLFGAATLPADLMAGQDTSLRWIPSIEVERCLLRSQGLLVQMVQILVQRLREVQLRERGWLERSVHLRVCAALARVARDEPAQTDGRWLIHATHEHLAARSGVSRPKLSHELKQMERAGLLKLHRGVIELLDRSVFARLL